MDDRHDGGGGRVIFLVLAVFSSDLMVRSDLDSQFPVSSLLMHTKQCSNLYLVGATQSAWRVSAPAGCATACAASTAA